MQLPATLLLTLLSTGSAFAQTPRLQVQPSSIELQGVGDRHRVLVTLVTSDGLQRDVTSEALFTSEKTSIARFEQNECTAFGDGECFVKVDMAGISTHFEVRVRNAARTSKLSFVNDVEPVLTRLGCNQGACHGKGSGQNGFRLSLRSYAPEWDHLWITREFDARRINPTNPAASLFLTKPAGQAPHEGGALMKPGSREYQVLHDWILAGNAGPQKDDLVIKGIEILPGHRLLRTGQTQQLLVRAEWSDGRHTDVTWLTQFESNDAAVAEVSSTGLVKMARPGETAIRASFRGQVAVLMVTAPHDQPTRPEIYAAKNNFIDDHVFKKLSDLHIPPSDLCSDDEFLRRVFLDTVGILPSFDDVSKFRSNQESDKRQKVIDELLDRPEFVDFWALQLGDLLQNRKESDHDVRGVKGVRAFHSWIREQVASNRPWDELAREILTITGNTNHNPAIGYYVVNVGEKRESHTSTVVANAAQTFLGTRIGCAQCHNHPLEKYTQDDYYHFAGFFSRIKLKRIEPMKGATALEVSTPDANANKNPVGVSQPRTNQFMAPQPLDRSTVKIAPGQDPRLVLANWMIDPKNEYFAGAMVNRLWAHFLGVGLVEPIDDLRASNPPTNPELWKVLVAEFKEKRYDRKHIMRLILNSRTYQLSSKSSPENEKEHRFYSHYYARRLPAEVLLDALCQATGVPERFEGYPLGLRAVQIPDTTVKSYFLNAFGKSERLTACACERSNDVTLVHTLHLLNNEGGVAAKVQASDGRLAKLLKTSKSDADLVEELYLAALSRTPSSEEASRIEPLLRERGQDQAGREEFFRDLFWALLNTKEFAFNH